VILDIGLPGMSGYEVATSLRQLPGFSSTVIAALSGWGSPEDKRRAQEAGFDLHLTKPVFADQLSRALEALGGVG
jgi:CheY-like chemotaxis protein